MILCSKLWNELKSISPERQDSATRRISANLFKMDRSDPFTITSNHYINNKFVAYDASSFNQLI